MLVNRVKLERNASPRKTEVIRDGYGNFISCSLPEPDCTAKVYRVKDGQDIPFRVEYAQVAQEYEEDPFTPEQTSLYKRVMYSERGRELLNKLKNSKLITKEQIQDFFDQISPQMGERLMSNKLIVGLMKILTDEPRFKRFKRVKFDVTEQSFNTIPLKDLGLTKQDVFHLFQTQGLINI